MDIKKASVKDYDKVLELWNSSKDVLDFGRKFDKKDLNNITKTKNELIFVAKLNKQVIGTIFAEIKPMYCHVSKLLVDTIYRNKGVGTKMLKEMEKFARKKSCKRMICFLEENCEAYSNFWGKNKYEPTNIAMFQRKL